MTAVSISAPKRVVELTVDGQTVRVTEGSTILDACRRLGIDTPTLCYGDTLTPVNVCRVCVVELEKARTLVPACSRKVEDGMVVHTDSERVRTSRRLVLELLGSAADLSTAPEALEYIERYEAQSRSLRPGLAHGRAGGEGRQRAVRPRLLEVHPLLQVRRGVRGRRPEHVRDHGRRPRLRRPHLHRARRPAARVGVRLLRQLRRRLSDRCADGEERVRPARGGRLARGGADPGRHRLPVLRRRLQPHAARPGRQRSSR